MEVDTTPSPALSEADARDLDVRIRQTAASVDDHMSRLLDLLEEAASGEIHVALGFPSWTAYLADACRFTVSNRAERKELVALMSGHGMSQRAIAKTLGTSPATVNADLAGVQNRTPANVTGMDDKRYLSTPTPTKPRRGSFTGDIGHARGRISNLRREADRIVAYIEKLQGDDRYAKYREDFQRIGDSIAALVVDSTHLLTDAQRSRIAERLARAEK